jgi:hypothetical protein
MDPARFTALTLRLGVSNPMERCAYLPRYLFVHRKGVTRTFGSGHESLTETLRKVGQPVGGSMGTGSYILVGKATAEEKAFSSACHGAGRALSRHAVLKHGVAAAEHAGLTRRAARLRPLIAYGGNSVAQCSVVVSRNTLSYLDFLMQVSAWMKTKSQTGSASTRVLKFPPYLPMD